NSASYINGNNNNFHFIQMNNDVSIDGNNNYDTLYFNNPGHIVTLQANKTQTINNALEINASGGFPVSLQSSVAGTQATIFKASDTVCVNYIFMQDIKATGGAQFYAGLYSSNISNNTGWQFTNCVQPISNVWPGDANHDLMTDNLDIIYIGVAYNETGFVRPSASLTYTAQPCLDWNRVFTNLANIKHADCDGNGVVDANDTSAVALNYGIANTGRLAAPQQTQASSSNADLYFAPTQSTYLPGSFVSVPIDLGTSITPASNVYGLAFTVQYDATKIQAGSVSVSYNNSWLVPSNNLVHLEKDFYSAAHVAVGVARTSHTNITGNGTIAYLNFKVAANASNGPINLAFSIVTVMDVNQTIIPVNSLGNLVTVGIDNVVANVSNVNVYPNPLAGETTISYSLANASFVEVSVYTPEGMLVATVETKPQTAGQHNLIWDASSVASGIYFCKIKCNTGEKVIKLIKTE
ncbi:MAG TPA: T9SS type A sorting domain-containing protein, partial [Bacteroidia bacterium]|nr:T9SS type A sorting domain-containing protein [Bacteroidia bacterium]